MNMVRTIIISFFLFCGASAIGQSGIRATLLDFESISKKFNPNFLIGFDRDITDRTSFGIDIIKSFSFNPEGTGDEVMSGTSTTYYNMLTNYWGMQYRSQYFLSGSGYIATSIGFRSVAITIAGTTSNYNSSYAYSTTSFSRSASTTTSRRVRADAGC